ncbi:MAG: DUF72 domain-containing protein [Desulfobacterales bacterium]
MISKSTESRRLSSSCRLFVGTSGYLHTEWVEAGFYPSGTPPSKMLAVYTRQFSVLELNYTWYQMPRAEMIERQRRQAPPGFLFAAKLTRTLTHEIDIHRWPVHAADYRGGMAPLVQAGQLTAVLIQLPPAFDRTPRHREHLSALIDTLHGLPLAVEFRHRSWANDRVFAELEKRRITLVAVDGPDLPDLFPPLALVTNPDLFYVRFHGRSRSGWRAGKMQHQFNYNYSDEELHEWVEGKIEPMNSRAHSGIVFFNNHVRAQAPQNALRMMDLLKEKGMFVVSPNHTKKTFKPVE